ncbi:major histocompatibility complex class I-related gene protein-like [Salminus brasiliensis]|uniref:major histocompatibility complex class I-related gene protein-like n=1 Tax=Salminus brasiliensis TaxID=930266 RepID=UPI003B834AE4
MSMPRTLVLVGVLFMSIFSASSEVHVHQAIFIYGVGTTKIPKNMSSTFADGLQISHYDSNSGTFNSSWEWMRESMKTCWEEYKHLCLSENARLKYEFDSALEHFRRKEDVHIFQWISYCTWDDESGDFEGYEEYGCNGDDFILLDVKKRRYIAHTPEAAPITDLWNKKKAWIDSRIQYYTSACADCVKMSVAKLHATVRPEVYLWQKNSSSPVGCLATGFYSRAVKIMWQRNGEDVHGDEGEILCNGDGTFQKRSFLRVKPEEWRKNRYSCVVQHQNWKDKIIKNVTEVELKNEPKPSVLHDPKRTHSWAVISFISFLFTVFYCIHEVCSWADLARTML